MACCHRSGWATGCGETSASGSFPYWPEEETSIFSVRLDIRRLSGEDASWRRVNQRFMNVIRKQFLIWRTVEPQDRENYREKGRQMLEDDKSLV